MRNFANELRRAFGWGWVAAVGIMLVPLSIENMDFIPKLFTEKVDAISLIINGFHKSAIMPIHLFALACPFATSSLSDIRCGVIKR